MRARSVPAQAAYLPAAGSVERPIADAPGETMIAHMDDAEAHRPLCTIELIAEGHAGRCPGVDCAFWSDGCVLARVESELDGRPDVARLLLDLRREVESGRQLDIAEATARLHERLGDE